MAEYRTYKDLDVWKKARSLVKEVYLMTRNFPKDEMYGLMSQMRRCAVSIPSNIAEGYGRQFKKETIQFLHIARGSLFELETQLFIASDLSYIDEECLEKLLMQLDDCKKLLNGLIKYFENKESLK
ncbi:MAG TPA: four helix bundle protein [Chitinophagaceae bacterium]|nr:four helix bundle protein [Chitinophagaceae bacterium]